MCFFLFCLQIILPELYFYALCRVHSCAVLIFFIGDIV